MRKIIILIALCFLCGCAKQEDHKAESPAFISISSDEAIKMMQESEVYILLDVRTMEEYIEGHIKNAICIPNEMIDDTVVDTLTDMDQLIFVYCRSGRRSKEAAQKLVDMGYTKIYDIGGIIDWKGEIEK